MAPLFAFAALANSPPELSYSAPTWHDRLAIFLMVDTMTSAQCCHAPSRERSHIESEDSIFLVILQNVVEIITDSNRAFRVNPIGLYAVATDHPFSFSGHPLYCFLPVSTGYGDKLRRIIGAADPGAVPGGSTTSPVVAGEMTGPN